MRFRTLVAALILAASSAQAAPYWVSWEGNDYPENEGWTRRNYGPDGPQARRALDDGIMNIDGLDDIEIQDYYELQRDLDPDVGEEFVVQWGLRVNQVQFLNPNFPYDPGISVRSNDGWMITFVIGETALRSWDEQTTASFPAATFHAWELRSPNMREYELRLNGEVVMEGTCSPTVIDDEPFVQWGDLTAGTASDSDWDYFRFGVVPEPTGLALLVLPGLLIASSRNAHSPK